MIFFNSFKRYLFMVFFVFLMVNNSFAADFSDWGSDSDYLSHSLAEAKNKKKPVILYFHANWCGWCKKLNDNYLSSYEVIEYLGKWDKIQLIENNSSEFKELKRKYQVRGYPSFIIIVPFINSRGTKISPFLKSGNISTEDFVSVMKQTVRRIYTKYGVSLIKKKLYGEAAEVFQLGLEYGGESSKIHCAIGTAYYYQSYVEKNTEILLLAEEHYQTAIELQPDYIECQKNYTNLQRTKASLQRGKNYQ